MDLEGIDADTVRLSVATRFLKTWIQSHYGEKVLLCWQAEIPALRRIDIVVRSAVIRANATAAKPCEQAAPVRESNGKTDGAEPRGFAAPSGSGTDGHGGVPPRPPPGPDPVAVGRSNTLAHAAAKQVAVARRNDPVMFNPLYIHAGVGLGKTHLLQAIAWTGNTQPDRKVLYLTAERFMYSFVSALRSQTAIAFKEALRGIDVLVIADLQFLQPKQTQAEFSHTLNSLIDGGRQVVIAADRPPLDLESLDHRLRSRPP